MESVPYTPETTEKGTGLACKGVCTPRAFPSAYKEGFACEEMGLGEDCAPKHHQLWGVWTEPCRASTGLRSRQ